MRDIFQEVSSGSTLAALDPGSPESELSETQVARPTTLELPLIINREIPYETGLFAGYLRIADLQIAASALVDPLVRRVLSKEVPHHELEQRIAALQVSKNSSLAFLDLIPQGAREITLNQAPKGSDCLDATLLWDSKNLKLAPGEILDRHASCLLFERYYARLAPHEHPRYGDVMTIRDNEEIIAHWGRFITSEISWHKASIRDDNQPTFERTSNLTQYYRERYTNTAWTVDFYRLKTHSTALHS